VKTPDSTITPSPRFLLLGDSHAGAIGEAARARQVPFSGGPLGSGREFAVNFFEWAPNDLVFLAPEAQQLYRQALAGANVQYMGALSVPLVSTLGLGLHVYATAHNWQCYQSPEGAFDPGFFDGPLFAALIDTVSAPALAFYEHVLALGITVFAVLPPQRVPVTADARVFMAAQARLTAHLQRLGVRLVDVRGVASDASGLQRPAYCEVEDPLHGNLAFGELIIDRLLAEGI
jgi:hypothetical protein